jgi:hypothetical protein
LKSGDSSSAKSKPDRTSLSGNIMCSTKEDCKGADNYGSCLFDNGTAVRRGPSPIPASGPLKFSVPGGRSGRFLTRPLPVIRVFARSIGQKKDASRFGGAAQLLIQRS